MSMITIDLRWLNNSGMGTYLKNIVPGIVSSFPDHRFTLLGKTEEIELLAFPHDGKVDCIEATSPMYSIAEQVEIPNKIPKETALFFATHYNIPLLYRGRMLVTVYDLFHLAMPGLVGGFHKTLYARFMFNAVRLKADAIITISDFTKDELVLLTGKARQPIYPIHLGVDESWFDVKPTTNPHGKPYLLYVGNVKPHKNLGALMEAFGYLANDIPHDLLIVGKKEGFITGDTETMSAATKFRERVQFTGHVTEAMLRQYVAHADAFIFPSLYEGFGLPPLEAMAAGCPVIVSNTASLPEICGNAALYCDPHQPVDIARKISRLLGDDSLREALRDKGRARARQFTWSSCINETCKVIDGLLSSSRDVD